MELEVTQINMADFGRENAAIFLFLLDVMSLSRCSFLTVIFAVLCVLCVRRLLRYASYSPWRHVVVEKTTDL